jgi:hypothetical protein
MTEQATIKTVEHLEASRLPEPNWFWRRWLIYGCTIWVLILLSFTVHRVLAIAAQNAITEAQLAALGTLGLIVRYGFYTVWGAIVLYGVGASFTDIATLVTAWRTTRKETTTTAAPPATLSTPEAVVQTLPSAPSAPSAALPLGASQEVPPWKR